MAIRPKKQCNHPGCPDLTLHGQCDRHRKQANKRWDGQRGNAQDRGYDGQWQKVREMKASRDPLCEECLKLGPETPLDLVHHILPIETHPELRLVMENLMSLCKDCHAKIHSKEENKQHAITTNTTI